MQKARGSVGGNLVSLHTSDIPRHHLVVNARKASPDSRRFFTIEWTSTRFCIVWLVCNQESVWSHSKYRLVSKLQTDELGTKRKKRP